MRILLIPEDFRRDQYMLRPIFEKLMENLGYSNTKVRVCADPLLGGVGEALKPERLREILDLYRGMIDLFIICVDRDGDQNRRSKLNSIEKEFEKTVKFLAENAWEEIETWVLAGLDLPKEWIWRDVRSEIDVKGKYFEVLAGRLGVDDGPGGGRKALGERASKKVGVIRTKCPEDFDRLASRIGVRGESPV